MKPARRQAGPGQLAVAGALSPAPTYSVPTAYGHREVVIRGYVHEGGDLVWEPRWIARHLRSYEREDFVFDPLHYLALLEPQDRPLSTRRRHWSAGTCPEEFCHACGA